MPTPSTRTKPVRRYRISSWLDTKTEQAIFGIQCRLAKGGSWQNVAIEGRPLFYTDPEKAKLHCRWLNNPKGAAPEWQKDIVTV